MAETAKWSVRVRVERDDSRAMSPHLLQALRPGVRTISHAVEDLDDPDGPSTITMEVSAPTADTARVLVQHLLGEVRAGAGLPVEESQLLWVAPLADTPESSYRFREQADELLDGEQYELAVVAAQIHVELHMTTLLHRFAERGGGAFAQGLLASRLEWNATQPWQRDLLEHLLGRSPAHDFNKEKWKAYKLHVERRNAIVHRGQAVDRESALDSLEAVDAFWTWLNDAALHALKNGDGG